MCTVSGNSLFFDEVKFTQSRCKASSGTTCPAGLPENYRKNFKFSVEQSPVFAGLNETLLGEWLNEGAFDF